MTYEEFLSEAIASPANIDHCYGIKYENGLSYRYNKKDKIVEPGDWAIHVKWMTGGVTGGSCWDDGNGPDPHRPMTGDPEPEFEDLDSLVLYFVPNLSFPAYKALRSSVVKQKEYSQYEYYGNHTNYAEKYAYLKDIYEFLNGGGYLDGYTMLGRTTG